MKKTSIVLAMALMAACSKGASGQGQASNVSAREGEMVIGCEILPEEIDEIMVWQDGESEQDTFMYDMLHTSESYSLTAHYHDEDGMHMEIFDVSMDDWSSIVGALDGCMVDVVDAPYHVYVNWASRLQEDEDKEAVMDEQKFMRLVDLMSGIAEDCRQAKKLRQNEDLSFLRKNIQDDGALAGVACVEGVSEKQGFSDAMLYLDHLGYIDAYSFLSRMTEESFCNIGGKYLFLLVPLDEETRIVVEDLEGDATVFDRKDGKPLLVAAQGIENTVVKVSVERGNEKYSFYLAQDEEHGGFLQPNGGGVYDFTMPLGAALEEITGTIAQVRQELQAGGYLAAEMYIGNTGEIDYDMAMDYLTVEGYLESYPFLFDIDQSHFIPGGYGLIVLVPCDKDCLVTVRDMEGNELYSNGSGDPILLLAGDGPAATCEVSLAYGERQAIVHPREDFYNGGLYVEDASVIADYSLWEYTELFQQAAFDLLYEYDADFRDLVSEGRQWWYDGHLYIEGNECQAYWIEDDNGNIIRYYAVSGDHRRAYRYSFEQDTWILVHEDE